MHFGGKIWTYVKFSYNDLTHISEKLRHGKPKHVCFTRNDTHQKKIKTTYVHIAFCGNITTRLHTTTFILKVEIFVSRLLELSLKIKILAQSVSELWLCCEWKVHIIRPGNCALVLKCCQVGRRQFTLC